MIDARAFGAELAEIVKAATAQLTARIDALEKEIAALQAVDPPVVPDDAAILAVVDKALIGLQTREPADLDARIKAAAVQAVANLPAPRDGVDGKDGKDGKPGERGEPGEKGADGVDGTGLAGAIIDRDGNLIVTLTNGATKALGPVVGRDGSPGAAGRDGFGFDDLAFDYDGERGFTFRFQKGERVEERRFVLPVVLDRGVYRPDGAYAKGDAVSYGGSLWIAQTDTTDRPDSSADWRLSVKAGRNGKDGVIKAAAEVRPLTLGNGHAG